MDICRKGRAKVFNGCITAYEEVLDINTKHTPSPNSVTCILKNEDPTAWSTGPNHGSRTSGVYSFQVYVQNLIFV